MWLSMAFDRSFLKIYNHLCAVHDDCLKSVHICVVCCVTIETDHVECNLYWTTGSTGQVG